MTTSKLVDTAIASVSLPPDSRRLLVAYSGGLDSHVLLHLASEYVKTSGHEISAIHINHGLSANATSWAEHCRQVCEQLGIKYSLVELDARHPRGESPEAWARHKRYAAIKKYIRKDDVLMTAHHMDDMAETLLIQLFRGAGPAGLAAMPVKSRFGRGWHYRPLLGYRREVLHSYALESRFEWIEDESNVETRIDRNFLRNRVLPLVRQRWSAVSKTLYRASRHQAEAAVLLEDLARIDMKLCVRNGGRLLSIDAIKSLSEIRARNIVRYWIKSCGFSTPGDKQLSRVFADVLAARPDSEPCVSWQGTEIRRYRDVLFITKPLPALPDPATEVDWDIQSVFKLNMGELRAKAAKGKGIKASCCKKDRLTVKFRGGGELISKGGHHADLKKIFQQEGIPPCYRDYVPLIYIDNRLVTIPGVFIDRDYAALPAEDSWEIDWSHSGDVCLGIGD